MIPSCVLQVSSEDQSSARLATTPQTMTAQPRQSTFLFGSIPRWGLAPRLLCYLLIKSPIGAREIFSTFLTKRHDFWPKKTLCGKAPFCFQKRVFDSTKMPLRERVMDLKNRFFSIKNVFCLKLGTKSVPEALATPIRILLMSSIVLVHFRGENPTICWHFFMYPP